jgi:hypothetical protein
VEIEAMRILNEWEGKLGPDPNLDSMRSSGHVAEGEPSMGEVGTFGPSIKFITKDDSRLSFSDHLRSLMYDDPRQGPPKEPRIYVGPVKEAKV